MDNATQPIAVFGATGAQGGPVARALLDDGWPVRAIARTGSKLEELKARGAEAYALDLADAGAVRRALEGVAGAFVHLPFMPVMELMEAWAGAVGEALVAAEVPLAVFSSSGPVPTGDVGVVTFDSKGAADRILRGSGARIVFLEPTVYLGNLSAPFSAPSVVRDGELRYPPVPSEQRLAWISAEDQAALAIAALARPDLAGRTFRIGERLTGHELAEGVGAGLGRPVRHAPMDPEAFGESVVPMMGEQAGRILAADYGALVDRPEALRLDADTEGIHRELGVRLTPVAEWARAQDWEAAAAAAA
jgi:uncharacterized protein YbjT (DUF2867 family)